MYCKFSLLAGGVKLYFTCLSLGLYHYDAFRCSFYFFHSTQELLELLGIPVVHAKGEAEALCAQLNRGGYVEACITADSDAFLYGAKCVIKCIHPNSKVSSIWLEKLLDKYGNKFFIILLVILAILCFLFASVRLLLHAGTD